MTGETRTGIEPFVAHGGRVDLARAAYPQVREWTDLSTGIAPWAYPVDIAGSELTPLPDPAMLADLEARAAACFGVEPERVIAVPGSDMALRLLGTILPGPAAWIRPGYSGHRDMWPAGRAIAVEREALTHQFGPLKTMVLARPNNPDGWIAGEALLEQAARQLAARDGHLIVDEAFVDATPDIGLSRRDWPGLIVLRSFGKFFGLAGLRLGFVVAAPPVGQALRALIGDWPISTPALNAGIAAYADTQWQAAQRVRLSDGARRMTALFTGHGVAVVAQTAFFTLLSTPRRNALFFKLAEVGMLTRPFAEQPDWLRIGVPGSEQGWTRLAHAMTEWSAE